MVLLKWGWVYQRISYRFRPAVWKKRYLVLTTLSMHIHKSERGVISSLFQDNIPKIHAWSSFQAVKHYKTHKRSSECTFVIEPRDPDASALRFKCIDTEEKERWMSAIDEQLRLTSKIWSSQPILVEKVDTIDDKPVTSVLDKWLEQLDFVDVPLAATTADIPNPGPRRISSCSTATSSLLKRLSKRSSQSNTTKRLRLQKIISQIE